jgi:aryl-alcohol dehydrogenase-like predicted oxidoreductase
MPFNIFDQHYFKDNVYKLAKKNDKPVFIRSIFLQGLLLMDALQLPERLKRFAGFLAKRDKLCREFGLNIKELAIGYVKKRACGSAIIFGAETHKQVADTIDIFSRVRLTNEVVTRIEEELSVEDERLIDPSRWG